MRLNGSGCIHNGFVVGIHNMSHAVLPTGWELYKDPASGNDYYHQASTGVTQWMHPSSGNATVLAEESVAPATCQCGGCGGGGCGCQEHRDKCSYVIATKPVYLSQNKVCRACFCKECHKPRTDCTCRPVRAEPPPPPMTKPPPPPPIRGVPSNV